MPAVSRQDDISTGHGCFPPAPAVEGSAKVFIEGSPALREGDAFEAHSCGNSTHDGAALKGSDKVICEGLGLMRIGDEVSCGDALAQGSTKVFAG